MSRVSSTARTAAATLVRHRAPAILPRVVSDATAGDGTRGDGPELQRRLTAYLELRIPLWVQALEADDHERASAIARLLRTDAEAGVNIPPVVLLGTVAIGYRVIEEEIRTRAPDYGYSAEALRSELDLLRRAVAEAQRQLSDGESAAS